MKTASTDKSEHNDVRKSNLRNGMLIIATILLTAMIVCLFYLHDRSTAIPTYKSLAAKNDAEPGNTKTVKGDGTRSEWKFTPADIRYIHDIRKNDELVCSLCSELSSLLDSCLAQGKPWDQKCSEKLRKAKRLIEQGKAIAATPRFSLLDDDYEKSLDLLLKMTVVAETSIRRNDSSKASEIASLGLKSKVYRDTVMSKIEWAESKLQE